MSGAKALADAHERLLGDRDLQFAFTPIRQPAAVHPPRWLEIIFQWIGASAKFLAPFAIDLFWIGLGLAVLAVVILILREVMGVRIPFHRRTRTRRPPTDWRPEPMRARALLEDADRLADQGRYDEAAHLLLLRGIDDIDERRPRLVKPALTARDIAVLDAVPTAPRGAFSLIARTVETSLFGGRQLDAEAFARCRAAYEAFAFNPAWT